MLKSVNNGLVKVDVEMSKRHVNIFFDNMSGSYSLHKWHVLYTTAEDDLAMIRELIMNGSTNENQDIMPVEDGRHIWDTLVERGYKIKELL